MVGQQKKIAIILCDAKAGTALQTLDFQHWLDAQIEIGLIAQPQALVLPGAGESRSDEQWRKICEYISEQKDQVDGFILITHVDSLLTTSAAISLMIQGLGKPLIFTSSPNSSSYEHTQALTDDFGIRANVLNALQVVVLNIQEPAIVFGNRIIRATRAIRTYDSTLNVFQSFHMPLLGNIDFGVYITEGISIPKVDYQVVTNFEPHIFSVDLIPGTLARPVPSEFVAIVSRSALSKEWIDMFAEGRPVLIWSSQAPDHPLVIRADHMTWEAAVIKFGWLLGQTKDIVRIRELMSKNMTGELGV